MVNVRTEAERPGGEQLVADVGRLRVDADVFEDILGWRGKRIPVTPVVADLADPTDRGSAAPLSVWAEIDDGLASQPSLPERLRSAVFARLLESHAFGELLEARPESLPALAHVLRIRPGRSPEEGRREARVLVRDALLAGRALDALDFRENEAVAELLAEDLSPRWLACLGRVRRLWPASPPRDSESEALRQIALGAATDDEPAMAFWHCLRLAEIPACPEDLPQQARRRMKQLHPELHAQFMRHPAPV